MSKGRMEAFSDGVLAIIITIMVLELHAPHEPTLGALYPLIPVFLSYVMSFVYLGIYWNNHHHMLQAIKHVNGSVLWANMHLLFWLSLIPFSTAWMGENHFAPAATALYGFILLMAGVAYYILAQALIRLHGRESLLAHAIGRDRKAKVSMALYAVAVPVALADWRVSCAIYVLVAVMWLIPDRRIEKVLEGEGR